MHLLLIFCIVRIYFSREIMTTLGMRPWFECRIVTKNFDYSLWPLPRFRDPRKNIDPDTLSGREARS